MRKLFSVLTSFMFLFVPVVSKAMFEVEHPVCAICHGEVPSDKDKRVKTDECGCEFCKDHLIKWWTAEEKKANEEGFQFWPFCPKCGKANSVDFYNSILEPCVICLKPMSSKVKTIMTKKCHHTFCERCLNDWLEINNICPLCRTEDPCDREGNVRQEVNNEVNNDIEGNLIQPHEELEHIRNEAYVEKENKNNEHCDATFGLLCAACLGVAICGCLDSFDETKNMRENEEDYNFKSDFEMVDGGLLGRKDIKVEC